MRAVCIREVQQSLKDSVKRLLEDKIKQFDVGSQFRVMDAEIRTPGGGVVVFQGMQNHTAESIKSLEGFDRAWIEEAQSLSERSLTLLRPTIRKPGSEIWASWNPRYPDDPIDKLLRGSPRIPDAIVIGTTFRDNPWFTDELRREMEWDRTTDYEKYQHVWEGDYEKHSEARVFKNWKEEAFVLPASQIFYVGADWGFSVDPATLVRCAEQTNDPTTGQPHTFIDKHTGDVRPRKRLFIDFDIFKVGVEIEDLPQFWDGLICGCTWPRQGPCNDPAMHGWARSWQIVADSARPETISHLVRHGFPGTEAARKGANSVKEGVIFLQSYDIRIHPRCVATLKEFKTYSYKRDPKTGLVTPVLEDKENHIIDPVRYAIEQLRGAMVQRKSVW